MTTSDATERPADSEERPAAVAADRANGADPDAGRQLLISVQAGVRPEAPGMGPPGGPSTRPAEHVAGETEVAAPEESTNPHSAQHKDISSSTESVGAGQSDPGAVPSVARKNVAFNVSVLAGSQVVTWSFTLAYTVIVPRLLGPSAIGEIVAATSVAGILGVLLGLGTKNYLVREIVIAPNRAPSLIGSSIFLRLCLVPAFAVAAVVYSRLAHVGNSESWVLYLAIGATVLTLLTEPIQAAFQAFERMEYLAYTNVANCILQSVIGIALALIGLRAVGLMASTIFVVGVVLLLNVWWARRYVRINVRPKVRQLRSLVRESLAYWATGLFFMIYLWIDTVILSLMTDSKVVGWYGVSTRLFTTLIVVPSILSQAWLPRLVSAFKESPGRLQETARQPIELVLVLSLPICVLTAMTAEPVIRILFGRDYLQAAPVLAVLALVIPFMFLNTMLNQVVVAAKRQSIWTWILAGATIVNPVCNLVLIRVAQAHWHNGAIGAALSMLVTEVLIVAVGIAVVGRHVLKKQSLWRLARALLAALAMAGVMYVLRPFGFVAAAAGGGLVFMGAVVALRVPSAEEWAWARQGASNAGRSLTRHNPFRRQPA